MATRFDDWEGDFLAHHGIKGQKGGVRRFQNEDGSLTSAGRKHYGFAEGGSKKMSRQFNRQVKKLNRLATKADVNAQKEAAEKYDRRAKTGLKVAGVGAAVAGIGAAAEYGGADLRNKLISNALRVSRDSEFNSHQINSKQYTDDWLYWDNKRRELSGTELGDWNRIYDVKQKQGYETYKRNETAITNHGRSEREDIHAKSRIASNVNKGLMAVGGATAAVAGGYTAYAAIRSKVAKARTTDKGHAKAVEKYKQQYSKMMNQFANTPYSELVKKQRKKV